MPVDFNSTFTVDLVSIVDHLDDQSLIITNLKRVGLESLSESLISESQGFMTMIDSAILMDLQLFLSTLPPCHLWNQH